MSSPGKYPSHLRHAGGGEYRRIGGNASDDVAPFTQDEFDAAERDNFPGATGTLVARLIATARVGLQDTKRLDDLFLEGFTIAAANIDAIARAWDASHPNGGFVGPKSVRAAIDAANDLARRTGATSSGLPREENHNV